MDRSTYDNGNAWGGFSETSSKTAGFTRLKRLKLRLPMKPYRWSRVDGTSPLVYIPDFGGYRNERNARGFYGFTSSVESGFVNTATGGTAPCPSISGMRQIVENELLSKVRNTQVDLGVALGEYKETAKTFVQSAHWVLNTLRNVRRRSFNVEEAFRDLANVRGRPTRVRDDFRDFASVSSNLWLMYSYGIRPLIKDVYDACSALQKRYQEKPPRKRVKANRFESVSAFAKGGAYSNLVRGSISMKGEIGFAIDNPLLKTLDECGVLNPLSVAWELVPLSFVVDWFIPVGKFLTNVVPPQGVSYIDGWISYNARGSTHNETNLSYWKTKADTRETLKGRIILSSFPRYHVVVPDLSLTKSQVASATALLWQFRSKIADTVVPGRH